MTIGGRSVPDTIQLQHWLTLVPATRGAQRLLIKNMNESAERIRAEADALLVELEDAGITHAILKTIRGVIETRTSDANHREGLKVQCNGKALPIDQVWRPASSPESALTLSQVAHPASTIARMLVRRTPTGVER